MYSIVKRSLNLSYEFNNPLLFSPATDNLPTFYIQYSNFKEQAGGRSGPYIVSLGHRLAKNFFIFVRVTQFLIRKIEMSDPQKNCLKSDSATLTNRETSHLAFPIQMTSRCP